MPAVRSPLENTTQHSYSSKEKQTSINDCEISCNMTSSTSRDFHRTSTLFYKIPTSLVINRTLFYKIPTSLVSNSTLFYEFPSYQLRRVIKNVCTIVLYIPVLNIPFIYSYIRVYDDLITHNDVPVYDTEREIKNSSVGCKFINQPNIDFLFTRKIDLSRMHT